MNPEDEGTSATECLASLPPESLARAADIWINSIPVKTAPTDFTMSPAEQSLRMRFAYACVTLDSLGYYEKPDGAWVKKPDKTEQ